MFGSLEDERSSHRLQPGCTRESDGLSVLDFVSHLKKSLSSNKGRPLKIDSIQIWKAFHSDIDDELSDNLGYEKIELLDVTPISFLLYCIGKM